MRAPLVAPMAAIAAGIVAERYADFAPAEVLWAAGALAALAIFGAWSGSRRAAVAACLAGLCFAGAFAAVVRRPGPEPRIDAGPREVVVLTGCVVEPPIFSDQREQFTLELEPDASARVSFYIRPGEKPPELRYGERVEVDARVRPVQNFRNPGAFNYRRYLARQAIYWTAAVPSAGTVRVLPGDCGSHLRRALFALRSAALERIERLYRGDRYDAAMMQAVLIGESSRLEKVWTEDFRRTGTYHALVISGLHVAVLAGSLLFLMRLAFVPEAVALAATMATAWMYALVSGGQAPVVRAAAGFTLYVVARYFYRRTRLLNLLAAVAIAFLLCDPEEAFDASFQLSFLSVAAIGAFAAPLLETTTAPLARGLRQLHDANYDLRLEPRVAQFRVELRLAGETLWWWTRIPARALAGALAVALRAGFLVFDTVVISALVQFGLALPMAVYFHRLSLTGLSANVAIVPLMSAVVPAGFAAIFTGWRLPATVAGWLLAASQAVAAWHVGWEPAWRIPEPPLWAAAALTAAVLACAISSGWRRAAAAGIAVALLAVVVIHPFAPEISSGSLELTAIDVGQSESLLLVFPDGKIVLLDAGGFPPLGGRTPRLDIGEDVVSPYLWSRSIRRLDAVILSHAHEDHMGGLAAVIENFRPAELWAPPLGESAEWKSVQRAARARGVRIVRMAAPARFPYGGAGVEALAPAAGYEPAAVAHNNDSLVLRVTHGRHAFLLAGDAEKQVEWALLDRGPQLKADVLKVAHHGSRTSTTAEFIAAVRPAVAVISAGFGNSFNNPHPEIVERLESRGVAVLRTDVFGLVSVTSDGVRLRIDTMRWKTGAPGLVSGR